MDFLLLQFTILFYYEYPEVLSVVTRDIRHGVRFGLGTFTLDPLLPPGNESFAWAIGNLSISYAPPARVCITLPVSWPGGTRVDVHGLAPHAQYDVSGGASPPRVEADAEGVVRFVLPVSRGGGRRAAAAAKGACVVIKA